MGSLAQWNAVYRLLSGIVWPNAKQTLGLSSIILLFSNTSLFTRADGRGGKGEGKREREKNVKNSLWTIPLGFFIIMDGIRVT